MERTMNRTLALLLFLCVFAFGGAANAQLYKWVDKDGKTRYGDTPPPGAKKSEIKAPPPGAPAPTAASKDGKPLTPAQQEQEFRKRQAKDRDVAEKSETERQESATKTRACEQSREALRTLQSGQRVARTDAKGERFFLDETQVAEEVARATQTVQQTCK
jgi:hypothetical protein